MAISDAGATGHFVLPGTHVKNIKPTEKPLCINLPDVQQLKSTYTCQIDIPGIAEAATISHIVTVLAHTYLVSIKIIYDAGYKV